MVDRIPIREFLALAAFFCFVFWDVYIPSAGIRPLDVSGGILLIVGFCSPQVRNNAGRSVRYAIPALCLAVICAATVGVLADTENTRAGIGICAGAAVFVLFSFWPLSNAGLLRVINAALFADLAAFWLQFAWYHATGVVLNFYAVLGAQPRLLGTIFRAAGLYLEPASFALMSFSLIALRIYLSDRFSFIFWVTVVSMFMSLSLWGVASAGVLVTLFAMRRVNGFVIIMTAIIVIGVVVASAELWQQLWLVNRLTHLASDPSANARYGALLQFGSSDWWKSSIWFGGGVQINYYTFGDNGLSYLLTSVGLVGTFALGAGIALRAKAGWRLYVLIVVGLLLTAAYLWTFMYWWALLALFGRTDLDAPKELRVEAPLAVPDTSRYVRQ